MNKNDYYNKNTPSTQQGSNDTTTSTRTQQQEYREHRTGTQQAHNNNQRDISPMRRNYNDTATKTNYYHNRHPSPPRDKHYNNDYVPNNNDRSNNYNHTSSSSSYNQLSRESGVRGREYNDDRSRNYSNYNSSRHEDDRFENNFYTRAIPSSSSAHYNDERHQRQTAASNTYYRELQRPRRRTGDSRDRRSVLSPTVPYINRERTTMLPQRTRSISTQQQLQSPRGQENRYSNTNNSRTKTISREDHNDVICTMVREHQNLLRSLQEDIAYMNHRGGKRGQGVHLGSSGLNPLLMGAGLGGLKGSSYGKSYNGHHDAANQQRKTALCKYFLKGVCRNGGECSYAHGIDDLKEKPNLHKTSWCTEYLRTGRCPALDRGVECNFCHEQAEFRDCLGLVASARACRL